MDHCCMCNMQQWSIHAYIHNSLQYFGRLSAIFWIRTTPLYFLSPLISTVVMFGMKLEFKLDLVLCKRAIRTFTISLLIKINLEVQTG